MAGLVIYRSHLVEVLGAALGALLLAAPPGDPLAPVRIGVPGRGLADWLRAHLARSLGIAANLEFPFSSAAIEAAVEAEDGASPWTRELVQWAILAGLPGLLDDERFADLRGWVRREAGVVERRELRLAHELADTFDRYLHWRPELVAAWSRGLPEGVAGADADLAWQPVLWSEVQGRLGQDPRVRWAAEGLAVASQEPIRLFGVSHLPRTALTHLLRLAEQVDVDLFLLVPSQEYLGDRARGALEEGAPGHPLLDAMGRVGRDLQQLLADLPEDLEVRQVDLFPALEAPSTLLGRLQGDLLADRAPEREAVEEGDDSVQVHAASSPVRQVEVLRDALLDLLQTYPDLSAEDVLILTPDLETYAPLVRSLLPRPLQGEGELVVLGLPARSTEASLRRASPVGDALLRLLDLAGGRLPASGVFELLTLPAVRGRFDIGEDDLDAVRAWLDQGGIRWGADAAHREREGLPGDPQNTWLQGLRRLALGVVMADEGQVSSLGLVPVDEVEGESVELLGRFLAFAEALRGEVEALRLPASLPAWSTRLQRALERLVRHEGGWAAARVVVQIKALADEAAAAGFDAPVSLDAIRVELRERLEGSEALGAGAGGVRLASLAGWRAVPARVVVLLGMDEERFPRSAQRLSLDLTGRHPALGDRDLREEDRFLFLQAILSARGHLILTYRGRDPATREPRAPAIPVSELLDALGAMIPEGEVPPWGPVEHPLQPFSARCFQGQSPGRDGAMLAGARAALGPERDEAPFFSAPLRVGREREEVDLDELIAFYKNPGRFLLQRRLRVSWDDRAAAIADRETLDLDGLARWELRDTLLRAAVEGRDVGALEASLLAAGRLTPGMPGRAQVGEARALVQTLIAYEPLLADGQQAEVALEVGGRRLVGVVPGAAGRELLQPGFGAEGLSKVIGLWVRLLALRAAGVEVERGRLLLTRQQGKVSEVEFLPPEDAGAALEALLDGFFAGHHAPLPLFPSSSWAFARGAAPWWEAAARGDDEAVDKVRAAAASARAGWDGGFGTRGDVEDPSVARLWGALRPWEGDPLRLPAAARAIQAYGPAALGRSAPRGRR
ncbi:MAG: exodeoxyribonuclease V subunit gamma [Deltaproteobacteria bacterium]|nr:exodeoxyribonuclease V subunit gamma [Deltaproteobacteria bacterium]